nr:10734_t:CDS:2 [Entrophospora candida]
MAQINRVYSSPTCIIGENILAKGDLKEKENDKPEKLSKQGSFDIQAEI